MAAHNGTDVQTTRTIVSYIGSDMHRRATIVHRHIPAAQTTTSISDGSVFKETCNVAIVFLNVSPSTACWSEELFGSALKKKKNGKERKKKARMTKMSLSAWIPPNVSRMRH